MSTLNRSNNKTGTTFPRYRKFSFRIYNPTVFQYQSLLSLKDRQKLHYLMFDIESGFTGGVPMIGADPNREDSKISVIHGVVSFVSMKTIPGVKGWLGETKDIVNILVEPLRIFIRVCDYMIDTNSNYIYICRGDHVFRQPEPGKDFYYVEDV